MKKPILFGVIAVIFCSCSSTQLVYMSVKEPSPVTIPPYIKTIGIIDRSQPSSKAGQTIDAVDKAVSLEGKDLDKNGAQASIEGLTTELQKNERFTDVKTVSVPGLQAPGLGVFPASLDWGQVQKICADNKVDALFALEVFDTDSKLSLSVTPVSLQTPVAGIISNLQHMATLHTQVRAGWRIYDPTGKNILDEYAVSRELSFSGQGINPVAATAAVISRNEAVKEVAKQTGQGYAVRIIPYWIRVNREYYVRGTGNFVLAKRKAQTGNWDEAARLWEKETSNSSRKIAGRAYYNMAIINEINGDLNAAIKWAQRSYENYNNKLALHYVNILKNRQVNDDLVKSQNAN